MFLKMALLGGADDAGSTMMEENVVSASSHVKIEASEVELQSSIVRAVSHRNANSDYQHLDTVQGFRLPRPCCAYAYVVVGRKRQSKRLHDVSPTVPNPVRRDLILTVVVASVDKMVAVVGAVIDPIGDVVGAVFTSWPAHHPARP